MKDSTANFYSSWSYNHVGVLFQIIDSDIKQKYGGANYLLQVWYDKNKIFEVPLKSKIININVWLLDELKLWATSNEYFMWLPSEGDEGSEYIHIFH